MIPATPKWIDTPYMRNILQRTENDESIKISKIIVKPALAKGDNYLSDIYRVGVEFSRVLDDHEIQKEISLIVKVSPTNDVREETITAMGVFDVEMSMMLNTLPKMNEMLTELGMTSLSARCLFVQQKDPIHLLFEDLASRGFRMVDRQVGLNLDHCLLAIRNLGRFHASSVALKEKDPKALAKYTKGTFHKDQHHMMNSLITGTVRSLTNEACKWNDLSPRISEKLLKLSEVVYEKGCQVVEYREDEFNVLNHGDFWVNNMLFTYDELQKPIDHIFVDFQLCYHGSPALDIFYFLGTSSSYEVRFHHRELLLREYHASLTSTMVKLKCNTEAPSSDDLQEILKKRILYEAITNIAILPMVLEDKSAKKDIHDAFTVSDEKYVNPACSGNAFRKIMTKVLPLYDSMGLLDD